MKKTEKNIRDSFHGKPIKHLKRNIEIANNFNRALITKVLEGNEVALPSRLGILSIIGQKKKLKFTEDGKPILPPDWVKTKQLRESSPKAKEERRIVYHTNEHTDGVVYKYLWAVSRVLVPYKSLYSLQLTRENKRAVHKLIMSGKEYFVRKETH